MGFHLHDPKGLSTEQFKSLVWMLSYSVFVRHWRHWNYPVETPWLMAIEVRDRTGCVDCPDLESRGFRKELRNDGDDWVYTIMRSDQARLKALFRQASKKERDR